MSEQELDATLDGARLDDVFNIRVLDIGGNALTSFAVPRNGTVRDLEHNISTHLPAQEGSRHRLLVDGQQLDIPDQLLNVALGCNSDVVDVVVVPLLQMHWDTVNKGRHALLSADRTSVSFDGCPSYNTAAGIVADRACAFGVNRILFSGELNEDGNSGGMVGVLSGREPCDLDCNELGSHLQVIYLGDGETNRMGKFDRNWKAYARKTLSGKQLEMRVEVNSDGTADVYFELDGQIFDDGRPAFAGLPSPVYAACVVGDSGIGRKRSLVIDLL